MKEARVGSIQNSESHPPYLLPAPKETQIPIHTIWKRKPYTPVSQLLFPVRLKKQVFENSCFWYFTINLSSLSTDGNL